jgi:hypothetical protein
MSLHDDWWASLNHGGLLISPSRISESYPNPLPTLPIWQADRLRRVVTAFDGSGESLGALLDGVLQDLSGLKADEWQKAQAVETHWAITSFTGGQIKPRRIWLGPTGEVLPLFVPDDGASRQFAGRLGVGRSRQLLSRVVEWLRQQRQPLALVTNGRQWRLVYAGQDYQAWCEWDIELWFSEGQPSEQVTAWRHLLSRDSLLARGAGRPGVLLEAISESRKGQAELSAVLGERVRQGVEELITASHGAIEQAQQAGAAPDYRDLYLAGTRMVMRCIITLFAEARGLLPVDNPIYQHAYSLEGLRQQLDRRAGGRGNERLSQGRSAWPRMVALFNLIYHGSAHEALPVPTYSGSLFEPGSAESEDPVSRALALLESNNNAVTDRQVLSMLRLLTRTRVRMRQGRKAIWVDGPVDFSALSTEYIGILYEGLLDFELKQADPNDPVLFLNVGNQPALTLSQLESMTDATTKQLFEALKKKDKATEADDGEAEDVEEPEVEAENAVEGEPAEADEDSVDGDETEESESADTESVIDADHQARARAWLEHAAELAGLIKKPRGRRAASTTEDAEARMRAGKELCARMIAPGQFYLVRWGGTRKGAGTFYTRPQLAAPLVRRTLQPLAFDPVRTERNPHNGLDDVVEWSPKTPEVILALKICDPAMGSGSFLAGALRFLTDALVQALYHHKRIERRDDGAIARLADGHAAQGLADELLPLPPDHEGFEDVLRAQLKRHVVERCIYGVDLDPLAVELGRMALWVETMDRNLPFGFLDHKLKVGNALVGAWFDTFRDYPAMAWEREGGDKDYQKDKPANLINHYYTDAKGKKRGDVFTAAIKARSKAAPVELIAMLSGQQRLDEAVQTSQVHKELLKVFDQLHRLPVHESDKRAALYREQVLHNPRFHALKQRMDLWCALWFWPGEQIELAPLPSQFGQPDDRTLRIADEVAARQRFFHWELEYPDVFTPARAGFDAVLGNPPWEIQKPNSKEFFSNTDPLYRAYGKQEALARQLEYFRQQPQVEHDWIAYCAGLKSLSNWAKYVGAPFGDRVTTDKDGKQKHDLNLGGRGANSFQQSQRLHATWRQQRKKNPGFADSAHPFLRQGSADLNTYKMFLELSHALLRDGARLGMIVPSGVYTDKGTTELRTLFLEHCDWQWLFGFENREGIFDIHRSFKFCPLIVQKCGETQSIRAAFMHRNVDDWERAERYVLAYPRARVEEFSPYSKAILEIRSEQDLRVLQKIYANGVLLGDQSERGWGIKYATEFHMTNDSRLFPPRPTWEAKGYQPDEYGHWLKGPWQPYAGPTHILNRAPGLVLSRDGTQALVVDELVDVALPLYEGRMIGQFDFSEKGWVSGKGRTAVWRDIPFEQKVIEPQYLMGLDVGVENGLLFQWKNPVLNIASATNSRSVVAGLIREFPCNHALNPITFCDRLLSFAAPAVMNSLTFDYNVRQRLGGLNLSFFVLDESVFPTSDNAMKLAGLVRSLAACAITFADAWSGGYSESTGWHAKWAITKHERLRLRASVDALVAYLYGLDWEDYRHLLDGTDLGMQSYRGKDVDLDPKGFWRIDKDKDPELRHTVLSLIAFHDLQQKGLDAFLAQNDGEGWMIPETLRLADYGLGHDERAQEHQPVASRLGPRFYDWQLNEDVERSWAECAAHAALIRRIVPMPEAELDEVDATTMSGKPQGALF